MKAELDVGPNLSQLLEQLASQIGTTVDVIFPWFVRQQVIEGITFLVILVVIVMISTAGLIVSLKKTKGEDAWLVGSMMGILVLALSTLVGAIGSQQAISQIYNPEFHAVKELTRQISLLRK